MNIFFNLIVRNLIVKIITSNVSGWNFIRINDEYYILSALVGVCFVFLLLTVILEASKCLTFYLHAKLKQHPLTYGQTGRSIQNDRSPLFSAIMIPSSIERIKRQRLVPAIRSVITPPQ